MEDNEIIVRVLNGDVDSFGKLIERYQRQLYYFVIGKVAEHSEAQDLVQKSFVTAYQNLGQFDTEAAFLPWVRGIALNHCRNEWRRYQSQATMKNRLLEVRRAELEIMWLEEIQQDGDARIGALRACLQKLDPVEQNAIEKRFMQEMSMEEMGRDFNKSSEAVRLWLYRIRTRLAECVRRRISSGNTLETV